MIEKENKLSLALVVNNKIVGESYSPWIGRSATIRPGLHVERYRLSEVTGNDSTRESRARLPYRLLYLCNEFLDTTHNIRDLYLNLF